MPELNEIPIFPGKVSISFEIFFLIDASTNSSALSSKCWFEKLSRLKFEFCVPRI